MANIRRSRAGGFIRGGRHLRETLWASISPTTTTLAVATPVLFSGLSASGLALRPFTIIRTRGVLHLSTDQIAASESYYAAYGMAVVSDQALAVGVSAVPTPLTEADSDLWFVYEPMTSRMLFGDATGLGGGDGVMVRFDSKAMRKVEDGQDIATVEEASSNSGLLGCQLAKGGRMLLKLL